MIKVILQHYRNIDPAIFGAYIPNEMIEFVEFINGKAYVYLTSRGETFVESSGAYRDA